MWFFLVINGWPSTSTAAALRFVRHFQYNVNITCICNKRFSVWSTVRWHFFYTVFFNFYILKPISCTQSIAPRKIHWKMHLKILFSLFAKNEAKKSCSKINQSSFTAFLVTCVDSVLPPPGRITIKFLHVTTAQLDGKFLGWCSLIHLRRRENRLVPTRKISLALCNNVWSTLDRTDVQG